MTGTPAITVDEYAANLPAKFLHCRELGHNWRPSTVWWDNEARAYDRRLLCSTCRTTRIQLLDSTGGVVSNRYAYPAKYLATGVDLPKDRGAYRLEAVRRFLGPNVVRGVA